MVTKINLVVSHEKWLKSLDLDFSRQDSTIEKVTHKITNVWSGGKFIK
jgi:hypothetical protein